MFKNWTFGRKVGMGFAVSVVALIAIAVTGYRSTRSLIANDALVEHTHLVKERLGDILVAMVDAETGQRGYIVTGKDEYLEPYTSGKQAVGTAVKQVRELTADNPAQQKRLDLLRAEIDVRVTELAYVIEQRKISAEAAATRMAEGRGKVSMDRIREMLKEMDTEESALLVTRAREAESSAEITTAVIQWGSIAAILLTILVGWLITSSLSKQVGSAARNMQAASAELQAAANQQASGAKEQSTAMAEIATTISELLATSRQIADSARRVAQIANETASGAKVGAATVAKGNEAVATVRRQVDLIVTHMVELGRKSQQVGSVLDIVAELAEQTNILAINATIEAAGAGETGRRFGVVADEIRKLADRVGLSTKEIRGMVDDVRGAVNTTVMATEAGSKAVDASALQVTEMATSFREIASLVGTTTDAAREIELSTKQQATAVEQVNVAITNVAQATQETEASASQTLSTSTQLTQLSTELLAIVQST